MRSLAECKGEEQTQAHWSRQL